MPDLTEAQFGAHIRDLLAWCLDKSTHARVIAHGAPPPADWTGCDSLTAEGLARDGSVAQFSFTTEFHNPGRRTVAKLRVDLGNGASATWEGVIPRDVVEASMEEAAKE